MTTIPDESDFERSRAAVAVACLRWLRCTGPDLGPDSRVDRDLEAAGRRPDRPAFVPEPPHPLWDRWIDG